MPPCPDCEKTRQKLAELKGVIRALHPFLDRACLDLQQARVTDIHPQDHAMLDELVKIVQDFKNPHEIPLDDQLRSLLELLHFVEAEYGCHRCGGAWHQELCRKAEVRLLLVQGRPWKAALTWILADFWGKLWLLYALPYLFRKKPATT
jgi:hypothetical protein